MQKKKHREKTKIVFKKSTKIDRKHGKKGTKFLAKKMLKN